MPTVAFIEDMAPSEKGRAGALPSAPMPGAVFDAVLSPNRSLPRSGFLAILGVVALVQLSFGAFFFSLGAWPVLWFGGLDILLVWGAFALNYRQGRLHERVRVTSADMLVSRVTPSGHEMRWRLEPFWTRVHVERPAEHEAQVLVRARGRTLVLGSFLSPPERTEFASALRAALTEARSARG